MTVRLSLLVACALTSTAPLAACGDDDGGGAGAFTGLYTISSYTENTSGCDGAGTAVPDATHLRIGTESFFGQQTLAGFVCPAAEGCGEGEDAFPDFTFMTAKGGGWVTEANASSGFDGQCALSFSSQTLTRTDDGGVRIETRLETGDFQLSDAECDPDAVPSRRDQLTCTSSSTLVATPVE